MLTGIPALRVLYMRYGLDHDFCCFAVLDANVNTFLGSAFDFASVEVKGANSSIFSILNLLYAGFEAKGYFAYG